MATMALYEHATQASCLRCTSTQVTLLTQQEDEQERRPLNVSLRQLCKGQIRADFTRLPRTIQLTRHRIGGMISEMAQTRAVRALSPRLIQPLEAAPLRKGSFPRWDRILGGLAMGIP